MATIDEVTQTEAEKEEEKKWLLGLTPMQLAIVTRHGTQVNRGRPREEVMRELKIKASRAESPANNSEVKASIYKEPTPSQAQELKEHAVELSIMRVTEEQTQLETR